MLSVLVHRPNNTMQATFLILLLIIPLMSEWWISAATMMFKYIKMIPWHHLLQNRFFIGQFVCYALFELYPRKNVIKHKAIIFLQFLFIFPWTVICLFWVSIKPKTYHWFNYKHVCNINFLYVAGSWTFKRQAIVCTCRVPIIVAELQMIQLACNG